MAAIVTISIEVELGWRAHDKGEFSQLSPDATAERRTLERLLGCCEDLGVPISFPVVGHLFHDECDGHHPGEYPNGWWDADPGTDVERDPLFYAPGLIEAIADSTVSHELATHTYSHLLCDEVSDQLLARELEMCRDLHEGLGLGIPSSIATPRHRAASSDILRNAGIETLRRPFPDYDRQGQGPLRSFTEVLTRDHPTGRLEREDGLTVTYCTPHPSLTSTFLPNGRTPAHPAFRAIPRRLRQRLHARYLRAAIDRAVAEDGHLHLWTHLHNLSNDHQWQPVMTALDHLARRQDSGVLTIERMCDLPGGH